VSLWHQLRHGLQALIHRRAADNNIAEEAQHYLEELAAQHQASGMPPAEALRAARLDMGSMLALREQVRDSAWENAIATIATDFRYAARRLAHSPSFSLIAIATLALGIGAIATIFTVIDGVLLRPLPYPGSGRLVALTHSAPGINLDYLRMAPSLYYTYREEGRVFEDLAIWNGRRSTLTGLGEPEEVHTLFVTHQFLRVLQVQPPLGRDFAPTDGDAAAEPVALLSHSYWRQRFGADPAVLNRRIIVDGAAHTVIGVLPPSFEFLDEKISLIIPRRMRREEVMLIQFSEDGIARLKPGVTLAQANADVARCLLLAPTKFPLNKGFAANAFADAKITPKIRTLKDQFLGDTGGTLWLLLGSVGILLLIACANVSNLLLVRADSRRREFAVRAALGASWTRLARELLLEALLLGIAGGALGLALCHFAILTLKDSDFTSLPRLSAIAIDATSFALTFAVSIGVSLLFGAIPVWKYASPHILETSRTNAGRAYTEGKERRRIRSVLVAVQIALAMMLLISSGLMLRTFHNLRAVDPGFTHPELVQAVRVSIPASHLAEPMRVIAMQHAILRKFEAISGVTAVSISTGPPMEGAARNPLLVADKDYGEGTLPPVRVMRDVSPGYSQSIGSRLLAGRDLQWDDLYGFRRVCLITGNLARELWGTPHAALGKRVRRDTNEEWSQIIGVMSDIRDDGLNRDAPKAVYWPLLQGTAERPGVSRHVDLLIRSPRAGSSSFIAELKRALAAVNPNLPLANIRTLETYYRRALARTSFTMILLAVAATMALTMGIIGIYGVIAYSVSRRRRDIGIRIALGSSIQGVTHIFLREGLIVSAIGAACGLIAALAVARSMQSLLYGVTSADPLTYALVLAALIASATLATWLPARRAATVDPIETLREE